MEALLLIKKPLSSASSLAIMIKVCRGGELVAASNNNKIAPVCSYYNINSLSSPNVLTNMSNASRPVSSSSFSDWAGPEDLQYEHLFECVSCVLTSIYSNLRGQK